MAWHLRNGRILSSQEAAAEDEGVARFVIGAVLALACGGVTWFLTGNMWDGAFKKAIIAGVAAGAFWIGSRFARSIVLGLGWVFFIGSGVALIAWIFQ